MRSGLVPNKPKNGKVLTKVPTKANRKSLIIILQELDQVLRFLPYQ